MTAKGSQKAGMHVQHTLNAIQRQPGKPDHRRVRRVVDLLMVLNAREDGWKSNPIRAAELIAAEDELDILLSAYTWKAGALFSDRLRMGFQAQGGTEWEGGAISVLVRFAESGELGRLRACKACGRLFYAFRYDKAACNAVCKAKHYDADPEHHAARLTRLRDNYAAKERQRRKRATVRRSRRG